MEQPSVRRWPVAILASAAIAWLGMFVHNVADLPGQTILSTETLVPTLITLVLVGCWFVRPIRRVATWALLVWGWLSFIGGILTVLPLGFLPFQPAQTIEHYGFHVVYAATQVPLIVITTLWLRDARRATGTGAASAEGDR